jgi:predicted dehydrogenase
VYRIAIVGFGRIAERAHLPAWLALPGTEIVAVADICAERRAHAAATLPAARVYSSTAELLREEAIDCLDICTPPHDHTPSILAACAGGVPRIVCEKPLTARRDEFARIVEAQLAGGSQLYTINSWLQSDLHRLVDGILAAGAIGQVRSVTLRTRRPDCALGVPSWLPRWRTDPNYAGGGIVLDHGWHQLYLMARWIGAEPIAVDATVRTLHPCHAPVEDYAVLDLAFPQTHGRIELSWAAPARDNDGEILGTAGHIEIRDGGLTLHTAAGTTHHQYGERLSDSSYHPEWFQTLFAGILTDRDRAEGRRNMREAQMLVTTLFDAYAAAVARPPAVPLMADAC